MMRFFCVFFVTLFFTVVAAQAQLSGGGTPAQATSPTNNELRADCGRGDGAACDILGLRFYQGGKGSRSELEQSVVLFQKACDANDAIGCGHLARNYLYARGVKQDMTRAVRLSERACKAGSDTGCLILGLAYEDAVGGYSRDVTKAAENYRLACVARPARWQFACDEYTRLTGRKVADYPAMAAAPSPSPIQTPVAPPVAAQAPIDTSAKGYPIYLQAQQREQSYANLEAQVHRMPNWQNTSAGYNLLMEESKVSDLYRNACDAGFGKACVDMARLLPPENVSFRNLYLDRGCNFGYRPSCRNATELAKLDRKEAETRAPAIGMPASAEEKRLEQLCDKSQWDSCTGYSKLAAPRLLRNCELGSRTDCVNYSYAAQMRNLRELRPIWRSQRALPAMQHLCSSWTKGMDDYETYCGTPALISEQGRIDALPRSFAVSNQEQRKQCIRQGQEFAGSRYVPTGQVGQDINGDMVAVTERVVDHRTTYSNLCGFEIKASCQDNGTPFQVSIPSLGTINTCRRLTVN